MKTKIGTEIAHVTRDSDTTFKIKKSRSPGRFTQRGLNAQGGCSGHRGKAYSAWESTVTLRLLGGARGAHGEEMGGSILFRHAHSLLAVRAFNSFCCSDRN